LALFRELVLDNRSDLISEIDVQLRHLLGQGVDQQRALVDARYARDVLLVCDGMKGTDLPHLARRLRQVSQGARTALPVLDAAVASASAPSKVQQAPVVGHDPGPPQGWAQNTSGFGASRPMLADFNLEARYGSRDSQAAVTPGQGERAGPRPMQHTPGLTADGALPWYSLRRWLSQRS
jgi:hypothetical protein